MKTVLKILARIFLILAILYALFALPNLEVYLNICAGKRLCGFSIEKILNYFSKGEATTGQYASHILQRTITGVIIFASTAILTLIAKRTYPKKK